MVDVDGEAAPGIMVYFVLKGDAESARAHGTQLIDHLATDALSITLAVSLGQVRTLIEHPSSMTHAPIPVEDQIAGGLDPGGVRVSFGLEEPADIIRDLKCAFAALA